MEFWLASLRWHYPNQVSGLISAGLNSSTPCIHFFVQRYSIPLSKQKQVPFRNFSMVCLKKDHQTIISLFKFLPYIHNLLKLKRLTS